MSNNTLSLRNAIFININIMFGVGIFINTVELARNTGVLGGFLYMGVGLFMLPLILSMVTLLRLHPAGNFYTFGAKEINPFAGFIGTWGYFCAKLASSAIMIHTSVLLLQQLLPQLMAISPFIIDFCILSIFIGLNTLNIKTGGTIQTAFLGFKLIPILFAILGGIFLFHGTYLTPEHMLWQGIPAGLPLLVYVAMGFEAAVSLSSKIENSEKNAPRAILISYAIVMTIATLYQLIFYGAIGTTLATAPDYRSAFPSLLEQLVPAGSLMAHKILSILYLAIASSALGGSYGLIFSNSWNLYSLAQHNHVFFSKFLTTFNKHQIPWVCVVIEGIVCLFFLSITGGQQVQLQQLAVFGTTCTYSLCALALLIAKLKKPFISVSLWIPAFGIFSCSLLLAACIRSFIIKGIVSLYAFIAILLLGCLMFYRQKMAQQKQ
jgi:amino acid transporter